MIGLVLIYFIGKAFYDLAVLHEKRKWTYAALAVLAYYGTTFLVGLGIGAYLLLSEIGNINRFVVSLISVPCGLAVC